MFNENYSINLSKVLSGEKIAKKIVFLVVFQNNDKAIPLKYQFIL